MRITRFDLKLKTEKDYPLRVSVKYTLKKDRKTGDKEMEIRIKDAKVDSIFIYTNETAIKFADGSRVEMDTQTLENLISLFKEAKKSAGRIGIAVA
jgi:hypothetical protein